MDKIIKNNRTVSLKGCVNLRKNGPPGWLGDVTIMDSGAATHSRWSPPEFAALNLPSVPNTDFCPGFR